MRSSIIAPSEELKALLMQVGNCVDLFDKKDRQAVNRWLDWLKDAEEVLAKNNFSQTSQIAGIRARLMASKLINGTHKEVRKQLTRSALESVAEAQSTLFDKQSELEQKIVSVREVIQQILVMAKQAGMINYRPEVPFTAFVEQLMFHFQQQEQLAPPINNAIATIGRPDTLRIMAEEIDLS